MDSFKGSPGPSDLLQEQHPQAYRSTRLWHQKSSTLIFCSTVRTIQRLQLHKLIWLCLFWYCVLWGLVQIPSADPWDVSKRRSFLWRPPTRICCGRCCYRLRKQTRNEAHRGAKWLVDTEDYVWEPCGQFLKYSKWTTSARLQLASNIHILAFCRANCRLFFTVSSLMAWSRWNNTGLSITIMCSRQCVRVNKAFLVEDSRLLSP